MFFLFFSQDRENINKYDVIIIISGLIVFVNNYTRDLLSIVKLNDLLYEYLGK